MQIIRKLYHEILEDEKVMQIHIKRDIPLSDITSAYPFIKNINKVIKKGEDLEKGVSLFIDKEMGAIIARFSDKSWQLILDNTSLFINRWEESFSLTVDNKTIDSVTSNREEKEFIYNYIREYIQKFWSLEKYLPLDSKKSFMFLAMNLLDLNSYKVVAQNSDIMLCLNSFREENPKGMKLTVADVTTGEIVGSIDLSLKKAGEDNFSYKGNVSYTINDAYKGLGYATKTLTLLKEYVNNLSDEYNKVLYISSLVNDDAYQKVALKNGGEEIFSGAVPDKDTLAVIHKIKEVKIYRISEK